MELYKWVATTNKYAVLIISSNHPGLTEINAPVGSKEVMSLGRGFPVLQTHINLPIVLRVTYPESQIALTIS